MSSEDRFAIQDLVSRYAYHLDLGQIDAWVALFTEQGVLDEREMDVAMFEGRGAIAAYGAEIKADVLNVVHLMMNHLVLDASANKASGCVFALCEARTRSSGQVRYYIRYEDDYVRTAEGWRFERRTVLPSFPPQPVQPA
ncbi:nuclear transport factor 2 family protein [Sphingobium sp. AN558]|uniref:nuclear transport factor 2 family protein n=1 Tax=Sphingobium sp. AN558 TaxID=3133442 RepID=UPI0030BF5B1D